MKSSKRKESAKHHLPSTIHTAEASASAKQTESELLRVPPPNIKEKFDKLLEKSEDKVQ